MGRIVFGVAGGILLAALVVYLLVAFTNRNDTKDCYLEAMDRGSDPAVACG